MRPRARIGATPRRNEAERQTLDPTLAPEALSKCVDAAFAANRDPLGGHEPEEKCRALFHKIAMTAKAPIGFG